MAGSRGYGLAFVHIPLPETMAVWTTKETTGHNLDVAICCSSVNTGLYAAFAERGNVNAVYSGHDHYNDFFGRYGPITVGYGRKTGMSGLTRTMTNMGGRGARVFELSSTGADHTSNMNTRMTTWVRRQDMSRPDEPQNSPKFRGQLCCGSTSNCPWQP